MSQNEVFFWFQKGFFERKKGHLILRQPPPHTQTHVYIYILIILYIKIHNITYIYIYIPSFIGSSMSRALATGVSTGTSLAVFWKLLEGATISPPAVFCPPPRWTDFHLPSIICGLLLGLLLGPVLEALVGLRLYLYQITIRQLVSSVPASVQRPLHRLI